MGNLRKITASMLSTGAVLAAPVFAYADTIIDPDNILQGFTGIASDPTLSEASPALFNVRKLFGFIFALAAITCIVLMLVNITKLGSAGDNASARQKAIREILISGIGLAFFGGFSIVLSFLMDFI